jgi:hypothetical protein
MIALVLIIETSACHRMWIYTQSYGLTELRFYTSVFMAWLVILFVIFIATVLRASRVGFIFTAVMSSFVIIIGLHFVNPDAIIAKNNLYRAQKGRLIDYDYLTRQLSLDAVPVILAKLSPSDKKQLCKTITQLKDKFNKHQKKQSWQS